MKGTVEFSTEIAISLKFTAEHTENSKAPENLSNDWNSSKTLRNRCKPVFLTLFQELKYKAMLTKCFSEWRNILPLSSQLFSYCFV